MGGKEPVTTRPYRAKDRDDGVAAASWTEASRRLADARWYWLATTRPDNRPHVVPVLAVSVGGMLCFVASPTSRKAEHLARDAHCVVTTTNDELDLVVEGTAVKFHDEAKLHRVAEIYKIKYGWEVTVRDGAFWADGGAPTAGPPPYEVYKVIPEVAFGFPWDEAAITPTRWSF